MTMHPLFLDLDKVIRLHADLIDRYGGESGIRDVGLLHSAISMPQASFGGELLHADLFEMAAAYLFHVVQNHAFLDGNKRTGAAAAVVFLAINGVSLTADEDGLVELTLNVAKGQCGKNEIAEFLRSIAQ